MKKRLNFIGCLCFAMLLCSCSSDDQEPQTSVVGFYADDEVDMYDSRLQFMTGEETLAYMESSKTRSGDIPVSGRRVKFKFHPRNEQKTDCAEKKRGLCFIRWTSQLSGYKVLSSDDSYPILVSKNTETGELEYYVDILLAKQDVEDIEMSRLNLPVEEDIVGVYDKNLLLELYGLETIKAHQEDFEAIPEEANCDLVVIQNNYLFNPSLGPYGGYRINIEFVDK